MLGGAAAFIIVGRAWRDSLIRQLCGIGYSDQTIHLGTYDASLEQLEQLERPDVSVEVVR